MRINEATWDEEIEENYGETTELKEENTTRVMFMNVGGFASTTQCQNRESTRTDKDQ